MARLSLVLVLLAALVALASASSAPTFCKCTCFTNSTIIKMGPTRSDSTNPDTTSSPESSPESSSPESSSLAKRLYSAQNHQRLQGLQTRNTLDGPAPVIKSNHAAKILDTRASSGSSCAECNRAYCLNYNLPICKGAEEKDVLTMCFQRDSRKDKIIVWGFILGTGGLLGYAAAKRAMEAREASAAAAGRQQQDPLLGGNSGGPRAESSGPFGFVNGLLARIGITGRNTAPAGGGGNGGGAAYAPLGR